MPDRYAMPATASQPIAVMPTAVPAMTDAMRIAALDVGAGDKLSHETSAAVGANVQLRITPVRILERAASPTLRPNPMRPAGDCRRGKKQNDGRGREQKRFHVMRLRFSPYTLLHTKGGAVFDRAGGGERS